MEAFSTNFAGPRRGTAGRVSFFWRLSRHLALYEHRRFDVLCKGRRCRFDREHADHSFQVTLSGFLARRFSD